MLLSDDRLDYDRLQAALHEVEELELDEFPRGCVDASR